MISGEGLPELRDEITRLAEEVAALEQLSREPLNGAASRRQAYERILEVEARLQRVMAEVRELHRQMTLIESWRR